MSTGNPLDDLNTTDLNNYIANRLSKRQWFRDNDGKILKDALSVIHAILTNTIDRESFARGEEKA